MLELFLSSLEDQLGLIVNPPLAPIARMGIISQEITRITSYGRTKHAAESTLDEGQGCPSCSLGLCPNGNGGFIPCTICGNDKA